jgi:hypothetical protein
MAEAEYWRFTVARDCQKKNTSENHSGYRLGGFVGMHMRPPLSPVLLLALLLLAQTTVVSAIHDVLQEEQEVNDGALVLESDGHHHPLKSDDDVFSLAWSPPSLITVGNNATATELFAAGSLESRLHETLGLAAAHIVAVSTTRTAHAAQLAVGYEASLAAGVSAEKLHGLGDDGYILLPLKQGGVALGAAKDSARGALNAAYGLLRAGGMRFLQKNVTVMVSPRPALNTSMLGHAVVVPFESRYALSRAGSPCSADHCPTNYSAALGFNGPHLHAPAPGNKLVE